MSPWSLYLCASCSGLASMALELLCARLFAPYVGAGLNTWSALIGATLLWLSLGYRSGGRIADTNPTGRMIARSLMGAGIATLLLPIVFYAFCASPFYLRLLRRSSASNVPILSLVLAFALLFYPMTRLGRIMPVCAAILTKGPVGAGRAMGNLCAWSTAGGLVGTLATGLILLPLMPLRWVFALVGALLIAVSSVSAILSRHSVPMGKALPAALIFLFLVYDGCDLKAWTVDRAYFQPPRLLERVESLYGTIEVVENQDSRWLLVDHLLQTSQPKSGAFFSDPIAPLRARYFFALLPYLNPDGRSALVVGLGGGVIDQVFARHSISVQSVEIDPQVVRMARKWFGYGGKVTVDDGRSFLRSSREQFDFIVLDAYVSDTLPFHLVTREAFGEMKAHLGPHGILAINLVSFPSGSAVTSSVWKTLREVFPYATAYRSGLPLPDDPQCLFLFASTSPVRPAWRGLDKAQSDQAEALLRRYALTIDEHPGKVLTDSYAPLDYAWTKVASAWRAYSAGYAGQGLIGMIWRNHFNAVNGWLPLRKQDDDFKRIQRAVETFARENGRLPSPREGLEVLLLRPRKQQGDAPEFRLSPYLEGAATNLQDPFASPGELYRCVWPSDPDSREYLFVSNGPDHWQDLDEKIFSFQDEGAWNDRAFRSSHFGLPRPMADYMYDPSNGQMSDGDIILLGHAER